MTPPSKILPPWALEILDAWQKPPYPEVSINDELEHRRGAFYRLYSATDSDTRSMWEELETRLDPDLRGDFLYAVILATDEIIQDEPLPYYQTRQIRPPRLKTKRQRLARKLAEQVQLLYVCTPPRCAAKDIVSQRAGGIIARLVACFRIGTVAIDVDQRWRLSRLGIAFTTDSKRGWMQHRRASDTVRAKVIEVGCQLLAESDLEPWLVSALAGFVHDLENLPGLWDEHHREPALISQKASYLDWFRVVYLETLGFTTLATHGVDASPLSNAAWATLAGIVCGKADINPDDIAHAVNGLGHVL